MQLAAIQYMSQPRGGAGATGPASVFGSSHRRCQSRSLHWQSQWHPGRHAITAVEMLIVVTVIGILAAAAVPKFVDSLTFHRVESAARRVKADLEHLRQTARLTSRVQTMTFTGRTYTIAGSDVRDLDARPTQYSVNLAAAPYEIGSAVVVFGAGTTISFNGYGMPSQTGQVVLRDGTYQRTVTVEPSGDVRISNP